MRDAGGERKDAETAVNRQRKRGEIPWAVADVLAGKVSPYPVGRPGRGRQAEACDAAGYVERGGGHAASLMALIASTAAMRSPIQRMTGTAIELPSAL